MIDFRPWGRGVSNKRRVAVPVGSRLRDVLLRARREAVRGGKGDLVIWQDTRREFESFLAWAGPEFDDVTWHVLRHTFATLMLRAGVTLWDVAGLLGDDYSTVQRVYGHHCSVGLGKSIDARWC